MMGTMVARFVDEIITFMVVVIYRVQYTYLKKDFNKVRSSFFIMTYSWWNIKRERYVSKGKEGLSLFLTDEQRRSWKRSDKLAVWFHAAWRDAILPIYKFFLHQYKFRQSLSWEKITQTY